MRQTNRRVTLALLMAFCLAAASCGSSDSSSGEEGEVVDSEGAGATADKNTEDGQSASDDATGEEAVDDEHELHIVFVGVTSTQSFSIEQAIGAEQAGDVLGARITVVAPTDPNDAATQVQLFNDALLNEPDGIVLFTLAPEQFIRPLADAAAAGIPVVAADVPLEGVAAVSNDNVGAGFRVAEAALANIPADATGSVVIGSPLPGVPVLDMRADGIAKAVAELRPGLTVVGPVGTGLDPVENHATWTDLVGSNADGVLFIGVGDQDAASLAQIRRTNGGDWVNAGFDLNETALADIGPGDLDFIADPQHFLKGYVGVRLLVEHLTDGVDLPDGIMVTTDNIITADNVAEIIERQAADENRTKWYADEIDEMFANPHIVKPH